MSRFDVESTDGTSIAVFVEGEGPPLVLVHGSLQDHTASRGFVDELARIATTFSIDRRGFGASGDAPAYTFEREFEDVAAVVDVVAKRTGSAVAVWGHSFGAGCAMGGATLTGNVSHLVLYEPGLGLDYPPGSIDSIQKKIDAGEYEAALLEALVDIMGMTHDEIDSMRTSPYMPWANRIALVPTLARECRVEDNWAYAPGQFDAIAAPALMLSGSESPPIVRAATDRAAAAIPNVRIYALEGHGHIAHRTDPAMVAAVVREFCGSSG